MQDFSDNTLDSLIERSLRAGAPLRPGQQARAWEALRARVVAETAVVAVMEPAPALVAAPAKTNPIRAALRWIVWLCLEESHYERAARQRRDESYPLALCGEPLGGGMWTTFRREPSY